MGSMGATAVQLRFRGSRMLIVPAARSRDTFFNELLRQVFNNAGAATGAILVLIYLTSTPHVLRLSCF